MEKQSTASPGVARPALAEDRIIQFGILCCAVTMVIVFAVAVTAS